MVAVEPSKISHDTLLGGQDVVLLSAATRGTHLGDCRPSRRVVVGGLAERHPELGVVLDRGTTDQDFWIRRAALLALLGPLGRGQGEFERFSGYADAMLEDKEFFVRKATGWVLRETAKKRPDLVYTCCYRGRGAPRE